jgi:FKBP-type peptidyl-prolyl cis-trans isomerase (trigger factor)
MSQEALINHADSVDLSSVSIKFNIDTVSSHLSKAVILFKSNHLPDLYKTTIAQLRQSITAQGLSSVPASYIENNYSNELEIFLQNFTLNYFAIGYIVSEIINKNILIASLPRITAIETIDPSTILFSFNLSTADQINIREWKHFLFRAPLRKNYKDLDKQVAAFIKDQTRLAKEHDENVVEKNDWIAFDIAILGENKAPLLGKHKVAFWTKINIETLPDPFLQSFIGKRVGDVLVSNSLSINKLFDDQLHMQHSFRITITSLVKGSFCSMDAFKPMFRIKNKSEIHEKLIEVFSYRNDQSQRKSIIEEMFHLFFSKHRFEIAKHLVLRKQEEILYSLKGHPDYQVYKSQKNFLNYVAELAERQIKEEILIDQIASKENIRADQKDIANYLSLFANQRLQDFVYFKPHIDHFEDIAAPIHNSILKLTCRREKTLNHILYNLTK